MPISTATTFVSIDSLVQLLCIYANEFVNTAQNFCNQNFTHKNNSIFPLFPHKIFSMVLATSSTREILGYNWSSWCNGVAYLQQWPCYSICNELGSSRTYDQLCFSPVIRFLHFLMCMDTDITLTTSLLAKLDSLLCIKPCLGVFLSSAAAILQ